MRTARYAALLLLLAGALLAIPLQLRWGLLLFAIAAFAARFDRERLFFLQFVLILLSLTVLALTPISTDTSNLHSLAMGLGCSAALLLPHAALWRSAKTRIRWQLLSHRQWSVSALGYLLLAVVIGFFLIPWYFSAYPQVPAQWPMPAAYSSDSMVRLFIGTNALGIWDELFFISTVFIILLRFFPFWIANLAQAALFTGFLYELGFIAVGPLFIYPFAALQGLAFRRTESITYVVILHLLIDAILFLTIMEYWYPGFAPWLPFLGV